MIVFGDKFMLGGRRNHCTLWAQDPEFKQISHVVCDLAELALCERERSQIEAACRRAFTNRPSKHIELEPNDFRVDP